MTGIDAGTLLASGDGRPVHFIGIAGAGMSALAELLVRRGVTVQGTDANPEGAPDLTRLGVLVSPPDATLVRRARAVVYSSAIQPAHPEMLEARALGLPLVRRAEALAEGVAGGTLVAIAGTHGKTTTTVMTTEALASAGREPTGVVGGRVGGWGGNLHLGGHDTFVAEADEYDRSFLALTPTIAVVLNVEADHLDIYRDLADITGAFEQFMRPAATVVRCADDAGAMALELASGQADLTYSAVLPEARATTASGSARLVAEDVRLDGNGAHFSVRYDGTRLGPVALAVPGLHNVRNALAALGAGLAMGCKFAELVRGLEAFRGVERRFQRLGRARGVDVIDDYAHHPTEIAATIAAARASFAGRRLIVIFQPHLYSRTRDLHREFADALSAADAVYLCDIYGAREQPAPGVTSTLIAELIPAGTLRWTGARAEAAAAVARALAEGDVVLTMGAGDITHTGPELLRALGA